MLTITRLTTYRADLTAYNLQIDQIHTYYAGATPVLVHNSCGPDLDALAQDATTSPGRGPTPAGRAYQKHMIRPGSNLAPVPAQQLNQAGEDAVTELLTNPRTALQTWTHPAHGPVYDFKLPGYGARWTQGGRFVTFLDP